MIQSKKSKKEDTYYLYQGVVVIGFILFFGILVQNLAADEIKFGFKSPSFNGVGISSHYLTIESQEYTRKEKLRADLRALENLESRIFAQISRQIVDQLFGENPATTGSFTLFDNIITWTSDGTYITLTIYNTLDETTTEITIPIGDFGFGG